MPAPSDLFDLRGANPAQRSPAQQDPAGSNPEFVGGTGAQSTKVGLEGTAALSMGEGGVSAQAVSDASGSLAADRAAVKASAETNGGDVHPDIVRFNSAPPLQHGSMTVDSISPRQQSFKEGRSTSGQDTGCRKHSQSRQQSMP